MTKRTEREPQTGVRRTITLSADDYAFAKVCMGDDSERSFDIFIAVAVRALRGHLSAMSSRELLFGIDEPDDSESVQ